jgi:hypothetical protein
LRLSKSLHDNLFRTGCAFLTPARGQTANETPGLTCDLDNVLPAAAGGRVGVFGGLRPGPGAWRSSRKVRDLTHHPALDQRTDDSDKGVFDLAIN